MSLTVDARQLIQALERLAPSVNEQLAEGLKQEARKLIEKANEHVPVKSGALRDSAFYALLAQDSEVVAAVAGYKAEYAPMVHERDSDPNHLKWFEHAFNAFEVEYQARAVEMIKRALERAVAEAR